MDEFFNSAPLPAINGYEYSPQEPDSADIKKIATLIAGAKHPIIVLGSDVWAGKAEAAALRFVTELNIPAMPNGMGRGVIPGGHELLVTKARSKAFNEADLVIVVGAPLDFRLGYGIFGGKDGATPAKVVHIADAADQVSTHAQLAGSVHGDLTLIFDQLLTAMGSRPDYSTWVQALGATVKETNARDADLLKATSDPIHPARIYGELLPRLAEDAVVIGDGGDFVSFAGKFVEPTKPGNWLDPGPYGCLGAGLGAAIAARIARPSSQVVVLFGDGAVGMSLIDVDTLVRHKLPVVMIVGNNSAWGLEKGPMQWIYGYDVAADLAEQTRYDEVVKALGGAGELVTKPEDIGPAIDRAFAANVPYLINVITDVNAAYPRQTTGI